jgi:hypothetical protein
MISRRVGGTAALVDAWRLDDLDGKPEGLAFTAQGHAVVGLDTRKPRRNLTLLEPEVAVFWALKASCRSGRAAPIRLGRARAWFKTRSADFVTT